LASNYKPASGNPRFIRSFDDLKKINLSTHPRAFRNGAFLWLNKVAGRYQAESFLLSFTNATADSTSANSTASTYGSLDLANAAGAPLFLGIAAGGRIPQQLNSFGQFSAAGNATAAVMDASTPFSGYYDRGIAAMPVGPTLSATGVLTSAVEVDTLVYADGFVNEATTGFYDPAGALQKDTDYYCYDNCVTTTSTAADAIGVVIERAEIGSPVLIVQFQAAPFAIRLGGV
jgi:hypothetical protein